MKNLLARLVQKISFKFLFFTVIVIGIILYGIAVYWSCEPEQIDIRARVTEDAQANNETIVTGYTTTSTMIYLSQSLLEKPGGFLSNDVLPPSVFMDNMPAWEYGALQMIRDLSLAMRDSISRSQSQSVDNQALNSAQSLLNIDHTNWMVPSAEGSYKKGIAELYKYRTALARQDAPDAQFYARADNLRDWLGLIEKKLGNYSQRLSASIGQHRLDTRLAGDSAAEQSTYTPKQAEIKTSWFKIDDEFYEARGASWALLHMLRAAEVDFNAVLKKKNATISLQQIIRELEATQSSIFSPIIFNGSGFGILANHSLVMANYISRANAALIDLRELLAKG